MSTTAFFLLPLGGTARTAMQTFDHFFQVDRTPFAKHVLYVDTEPVKCAAADSQLLIGIRANEVESIMADPELHGAVSKAMAARHSQMLKRESIKNGSRTIRALSQLAAEVHLSNIIEGLNRSIRALIRSSGVSVIQPVFFSSTGGGAGSALVVILGSLFADQQFRARITEGLDPHVVDVPVACVTEPFAFSLRHKDKHANKILANAFAFRIETALLEPQEAFQYIFHQGLANAGGAVFDSEAEICKGLGTAVYQLCRSWQYIKARCVDTVDSQKLTDRYRGWDIPERHLPPEVQPSFASPLRERQVRHRIRVSFRNGRKSHG